VFCCFLHHNRNALTYIVKTRDKRLESLDAKVRVAAWVGQKPGGRIAFADDHDGIEEKSTVVVWTI